MNDGGLDIALIVILAYFLLRGIFRGVVKEVVGVLGLLVAFWLASVYWPLGAQHLVSFSDNATHRGVISFMVIFLVVYFLISLISIFLDKIVKLTISSLGSSLLGALIGLVKGVIMCAVILNAANAFIKPADKFFTSSTLWPYMRPATNLVQAWTPEVLSQGMADSASDLRIGGLLEGRPSAPAPSAGLPGPINVDWATIQDILTRNPDLISPVWRDKLRSISGPENLSSEDLKRFIEAHPDLFNVGGSRPTEAPAPTWSVPAGDERP